MYRMHRSYILHVLPLCMTCAGVAHIWIVSHSVTERWFAHVLDYVLQNADGLHTFRYAIVVLFAANHSYMLWIASLLKAYDLYAFGIAFL